MEASDSTRWLELLSESEEQLAELEASEDPVAQRQIQDALSSKLKALRKLKRLPEAVDVAEELLRHLTDEPSERTGAIAMRVLLQQAIDLERLGEIQRVLDATDAMLLLAESCDPSRDVARLTLAALLLKLDAVGSDPLAVGVVNGEVIRRFADSHEPMLHEQATAAFYRMGLLALRDGRDEEALRVANSLIQRLDDAPVDSLSGEAEVIARYGRALGGWRVSPPNWRGRLESIAFMLTNTVRHALRLHGASRIDGVTQARWAQWRRRLETAVEVSEHVIECTRDGSEPDFARIGTVAAIQAASFRGLLGQAKRGFGGMGRIVDREGQAAVQAIQTFAGEVGNVSTRSSQLGRIPWLAMRARALGEGDERIERIAYDDSVQPILDQTSHRSVRWLVRLLRPSGKPSLSKRVKRALPQLRG